MMVGLCGALATNLLVLSGSSLFRPLRPSVYDEFTKQSILRLKKGGSLNLSNIEGQNQGKKRANETYPCNVETVMVSTFFRRARDEGNLDLGGAEALLEFQHDRSALFARPGGEPCCSNCVLPVEFRGSLTLFFAFQLRNTFHWDGIAIQNFNHAARINVQNSETFILLQASKTELVVAVAPLSLWSPRFFTTQRCKHVVSTKLQAGLTPTSFIWETQPRKVAFFS